VSCCDDLAPCSANYGWSGGYGANDRSSRQCHRDQCLFRLSGIFCDYARADRHKRRNSIISLWITHPAVPAAGAPITFAGITPEDSLAMKAFYFSVLFGRRRPRRRRYRSEMSAGVHETRRGRNNQYSEAVTLSIGESLGVIPANVIGAPAAGTAGWVIHKLMMEFPSLMAIGSSVVADYTREPEKALVA